MTESYGGRRASAQEAHPGIQNLFVRLASWYLLVAWFWLLVTQVANILWLWVLQGERVSTLFGSVGLCDALVRLLDVTFVGTLVISVGGVVLSLALLGIWIVQLRTRKAEPQLLRGMIDAIGGLSCYFLANASTAIIGGNGGDYPLFPLSYSGQTAVVIVLDVVVATALMWAKRKCA